MKPIRPAAPWLLALLVVAGCASSDVAERGTYVGNEEIARPGRIIVHDPGVTPGDMPADSALAARYAGDATPQTAEEIALGRKLGELFAAELVEEIRKMGMPAERAGSGPAPEVGDILIKGQFVSIDEGSRVKRMLIGFGAGASELKTYVAAFQVTAQGLRQLGWAEVESEGGKMPGMVVPVGAGAAAGRAATSAAVSGGLSVTREFTSENMSAAAKRSAEEVAEVIRKAFVKRGWIEG